MSQTVSKIFLVFVLTAAVLPAAEKAEQRKELEELRRKIEMYEQQISQKKEKEETLLQYINSIEKEIDLTAGHLRHLRMDIHRSERLIQQYQQNIEEISAELEKLKKLIRQRIVTFYKKRRSKEIELLLSLDSMGEVKSWLKYQKIVAEHDRRTYNDLVEKQHQLQQQQRLLAMEIDSKEKDFQARNRAEKQLRASRSKRQELLAAVKKDKQLLEQRLAEFREAQEKIRSFITQSEERRLTAGSRQKSPAEERAKQKRDLPFAQLKGQLMWPTKGEILSHFGRQKHPVLKTVTENLGVEIKAPLGSPIYAVDQGLVQTITWQRGRGNIIILNHDDGFYTVYTHLAEIHVEPQQFVEAGEVIGTVGDSGSMNGPVLHFQIWKNTVNLDPEDWLSKPLLTQRAQ